MELTKEQARAKKGIPIMSLSLRYGIDKIAEVYQNYDYYVDGNKVEIYPNSITE